MRRAIAILVSVILLAMVIGCGTKAPTTKQLAASFMSTYNTEYQSYKTAAARCLAPPQPCTADEKKALQQKKALLMDAWAPIAAFDLSVNEGKIPDPALQQKILNLINQLTQKGGTK